MALACGHGVALSIWKIVGPVLTRLIEDSEFLGVSVPTPYRLHTLSQATEAQWLGGAVQEGII